MPKLALLSVSNKNGLVPFAKSLVEDHKFKLISSGGTASTLKESGIPVKLVSEYTNAPEILNGRVKTLHPKIHGGILAQRDNKSHLKELEQNKIQPIDLVVVNLYPFEETIKNKNVEWDKAIENIDIGGPAMIRAAAKNHKDVCVLTSPNQYENYLKILKEGALSNEEKKIFALEAFRHTAKYDIIISKWIGDKIENKDSFYTESIPTKQILRYGENPHQQATWFSNSDNGWGASVQLQGKELSTNNLLDLEAALLTVCEFGYSSTGENPVKDIASVVIKHTNPCGVAIDKSVSISIKKALDSDRTSAFGGIVAANTPIDLLAAEELSKLFLECVVAPDFSQEAKDLLSKRKNLRLLKLSPQAIDNAAKNHSRSILGGMLIQDLDYNPNTENEWNVVTKKSPDEQQYLDLDFVWKVAKHVRSNAIAIASKGQSIGIGAGQMNRIGSAKIALESAGEKANGAVLASDGFFPFEDTVRLAGKFGIQSIIQPGGSIRDKESIDACNELGISMVLTNKRHFLH
tara:strand:+ start:1126 stop:2682 length:1557 start_codon:yes stop_codon:yes gene_type:complete